MNRFTQGYRNLIGTTQTPVQLYGGLTSFFAGCAMGLIGILIVLSGDILIEEVATRYKVGILIAALGMPLLFMGLQLTLPSRFIIHAIAGAGAMVCLVALLLFNQAWPDQWGPRAEDDRSIQVIGIYTLGLVLLVTTTAMALVVNFISRHMVLPGQELDDDLFTDPDRPVSMEEVLRDIEREVGRQKLTWGGMEDDRLPREYLKLKADFGPGATVSQGRAGTVTKTQAKEMDVAFTSLARLRGTEGREVSGDDDTAMAIDALRALKAARQAEMERSWWYRFKRWLVGLFTGRRPSRRPDHVTAPTKTAVRKSAALDERNYPKVERGSSPKPARASAAKRPKAVMRSNSEPAPAAKTTRHGPAAKRQSPGPARKTDRNRKRTKK